MSWSNATLDFEGRELGESSERVAQAAAAMAAYGTELIAQRKRAPNNDIISTVVGARIQGDLAEPAPLPISSY